jgi:hypothetical protein
MGRPGPRASDFRGFAPRARAEGFRWADHGYLGREAKEIVAIE